MKRITRLTAALGCVATLALTACATNAGSTPSLGAAPQSRIASIAGPGWIQKDGIVYHIPHYMATREMAARQAKPPPTTFSYYGGVVLTAPHVYLIFWGYDTYGDKKSVQPLMTAYIGAMGGSGHNNIYTQYYEKSGSTTTYITNPSQQLGGTWNDDQHAVPAHPSDAQVAQEAVYVVSHFGYDPNGSYVVATPHNHSTNGFGTQWCAYHSATVSGGNLVSYTNMPYAPDAGSSCGASIIHHPSDEKAIDEGVTIIEGHEEGESVTDPNPGAGWYNYTYGEIGDICAWKNIANDTFGTASYTMQPMFSNATQSCVHTYN